MTSCRLTCGQVRGGDILWNAQAPNETAIASKLATNLMKSSSILIPDRGVSPGLARLPYLMSQAG